MSSLPAIRSLREDHDFEDRLRAKQDEIAANAESVGRSFTQSMAELVQMQQAEILRLQNALRDNTTIPERYPVEVAIGSVANQHGLLSHVLLAVASDRSVWLMENYTRMARHGTFKWSRVPELPQAADDADGG